MCVQRNTYHDRLVKFFGILSSLAANTDRLQCVEVMIGFLVEWSHAKEPMMRWRVCQLIGNLVNNMPEEADVSEEILDAVQKNMLRLVEDGRPNVRTAAVKALLRFPQPNDDGDFVDCPVVERLLQVLKLDKSKEVRKAVISVLPISSYTLEFIVLRTRDESDDVRKTTYMTLAEKTMLSDVNPSLVPGLLSKGLQDRVESVVEAAQSLVVGWFDSCGGEPLTLLREMNGGEHVDAAELVLKALFTSERLDAVQVALLASNEKLGLRTDFTAENPNLMSAEEALFWRVVCVHLSSEASSHGIRAATSGGATANVEAATAGERLEAFEAVMPSCVEDLAFIICLHKDEPLACSQLLLLAAQCADFVDASGRKSVEDVIQTILTSGVYNKKLYDACFEVVRKMYTSDESLTEAAFHILEHVLAKKDLVPLDPQKMNSLNSDEYVLLLSIIAGFLSSLKCLETSTGGLQWPDILQHIMWPASSSADANVRVIAQTCLGLYFLIETGKETSSLILKDMFKTLISCEEQPDVNAVMMQALGDACLSRGPKAVQIMIQEMAQADNHEETPTIVDLMLHYAQEWLDADDAEAHATVGEAVVECLIKLVSVNELRQSSDLHHEMDTALEDGDMIRILVKLFVLCFDACTRVSPKTRQSLLVFFQRYATLSVTSQQYLATAMLPAVRSAAAIDVAARKKTVASGAIAPQVITFATKLLQMPVMDRHGEREMFGHEPLAEILMGEIIECAHARSVPKQYMTAMCKAPAALPMYDAGEETRETVMRIHIYATHAADIISDPACVKEMHTIQKRYTPMANNDTAQQTDDHVDILLDELRQNVNAFCTGFPEPFKKEDEMSDSDMEEDSSASEQGHTRRLPARVTRTQSNMNEISDDDDDKEEEEEEEQPSVQQEEEEEEEDENVSPYTKANGMRKTRRRQSTESVTALGDALNTKARIST